MRDISFDDKTKENIMIKACIFDLDGVIVDTAKYHYQAWKRLAAEFGYDLTEEENEHLKGVSRMKSLDIILDLAGVTVDDATKQALADKKNNWYVELISKMTPDEILPGAKEFLEKIRTLGIKTAIGSASKNTPAILKYIGLEDFFDVVIDGNKVSAPKPDPEVFLKGAEALHLDPSECVVFEDAKAGIEAALNGNMHVIGIGSPDVLSAADHVVPALADMKMEYLEFE